MVIGIDASRAFGVERTGTENYSYHLITQMLRLPTAKLHTFVLFTRPNAIIPKELDGYSNVSVKEVSHKYLWTQVGLAWETWVRKLDVLWIPAHTLPILRNPRVKTIVTIHGLEYRWLPEYHNWLQRWYLPLSTYYAAKVADRLICVSESTKRDLLAEIHIDIEKIIVIWEGTKYPSVQVTQNLSRIWEKYGIKERRYILFVGTVQPRKNLGSLIRAFAKFYSRHKDYRLVIAGNVGWKAESDLKLPEELLIPEAVIFTGRVSQVELQSLYLGAKMYVQPSWTEGFGLPVVEAMHSGVPTIVSDGGALGEVVGEAGLIVPLGRDFVGELAIALERVESDKKLRNRMIAMGLKRASKLTWEKAARETIKVLVGERV